MAILQVYGSTGAIQQSSTTRWAYGQGEISETVYKGVYAAVKTLYDSYKAVAGSNPTYDQLNIVYERGKGILSVSTVDDGTPQYELIANELSQPVSQHNYFKGTLTDAQIGAVIAAVQTQSPEVFTGKQLELQNMLLSGVTEYMVSSYVLRETKQVSKRSSVSASFANVNLKDTPPATTTVNSLIGTLPTGEWLKKAPQVRLIGTKRWTIQTEWWWYEKLSAILYGGTGTP